METVYNRHRQHVRAPLGLRLMQGPSVVAEASQVGLVPPLSCQEAAGSFSKHSALLQVLQ